MVAANGWLTVKKALYAASRVDPGATAPKTAAVIDCRHLFSSCRTRIHHAVMMEVLVVRRLNVVILINRVSATIGRWTRGTTTKANPVEITTNTNTIVTATTITTKPPTTVPSIIILIIVLVMVVVGLTFAYWRRTVPK